MRRFKKTTPEQLALDAQEVEAVAAARDTLARVIADGTHSDRSCAIDAIRAVDRGWRDDERQYSVTYRLGKAYDARFELLGSFSGNTDELPESSSSQMQAALYAIDHLSGVLLARLVAVGVAVYPTMETPPTPMRGLPRAQKDGLLTVIDQDSAG